MSSNKGSQNLILEGEHEHQDFKYQISDARKIARSISAFANNSNKIYESVGSNLSSKGRFELIRSNDWVTPNQSDIEEPLLNT